LGVVYLNDKYDSIFKKGVGDHVLNEMRWRCLMFLRWRE